MSARPDNPFTTRAVIAGLIAAVGGFLLFLVASAYAPDLAPSRRGGANALSKSAVGYAGLVRLLGDTGDVVRTARVGDALDGPELVVVTPTIDTAAEQLDELLLERDGKPTLLVLPFHQVEPLPRHRGWARRVGTNPDAAVLDRNGVSLRTLAPDRPRSLEGEGTYPMLRDRAGAVILGEVRGENLYVLTDARLLNNAGLATLAGARGALSLLDKLRSAGEGGTVFDLTLAGFADGPSLLKLMFEPPFVGLTACLLAAALLAGWAGAVRFGAPAAEGRALPLGKRSLLDNTAALLRRAGRTHAVSALYAEVVRGQIARMGRGGSPPAGLDGERLDALTGALAAVDTEARLLGAARALHGFKRGVVA